MGIGVALALRKKILMAPTLQFITKLVYRWKASHRNGRVVPNFTAFIFNAKLSLKVKTTKLSSGELSCQQLKQQLLLRPVGSL